MSTTSRISTPPHPRHVRLAEQIVQAAVAGAWPAGARVIEQKLARSLAVSRTPVRAALRLLRRHGVVQVRPHRGHVLVRPGAELVGFHLPTQAPAEARLHDALIRDRLARRIGPELAQSALARRYQTGLTVVRRALARLEDEGLVRRDGWRWSFIPSLDTEQSRRASYEIRLMLEPPSLMVPGFRAEPDQLAQLMREHRLLVTHPDMARDDPARVFELDARFHETLAAWSGNPFVASAVHHQNALRRLIELASYADRTGVVLWCREHLAILTAIAASDSVMAAQLMRRHLLRAAEAAEHSRPSRGGSRS